jgi:hypothetical protein
MEIITHISVGAAEVISDDLLINTREEALQLLVDIYYNDFDKIIIHTKNLTHDFFDLKNGFAGDVLQKFSNYRVRLLIVGDFSKYESKSIKEFIFECNKGRQVNFVGSTDEALKLLSI